MKNILITGGAGFIGSNLALKLSNKGYQVTVLDNLSEQIHGKSPELNSTLYIAIKDKVNFIKGSVTSKSDLEKSIKGQDVIVHLAAETGTGQSMYQVERYSHVNIHGTALLMDVLANNSHSIKKVVVASSRAIYGEGKYYSKELGIVYPTSRNKKDMNNGDFEVKYQGSGPLTLLATDENSKLHPSSIYGITKQTQEQLVLTTCNSIGIPAVSFRYQNVYGPGQSLSNPYTGILSIFSNRIRKGLSLNIFEDGLESRDFVFIDDVVDATIAGIEKDGKSNNVFNVGTGKAISVLSVANTLIKEFGSEIRLKISGQYRLGDIRHNYADILLINTKLGFSPKVDFSKGIKKFVEWVKTQPVMEDKYEFSLKEMQSKGLFK